MKHELYLIIICAIVAAGIIIIGKLYDRIEKLKAELDDADAELKELDLICLKARRSNGKANAYIEQLNAQLDVMGKSLSKYKKEAKGYEISLNAVEAEHRKTVQQLYGRIGAMQRRINKLKSVP